MKGRTITFGKYKGTQIIELIATHIGYIMWCLENVKNFYLTEEEQILYDASAISILRDKIEMTFPRENLRKFIKDEERLANMKSPYVHRNGKVYIDLRKCGYEFRAVYEKYKHILRRKEEEMACHAREASYADFMRFLTKKVEDFEDMYPLGDCDYMDY